MNKITINCPPEPVIRKHKHWWWPFGIMQAQPITATGTILGPDGAVGEIEIVFPLCDVHRIGIGHFMVDAVTAEGTVVWTKRSHH
jgi:hypothetical protein